MKSLQLPSVEAEYTWYIFRHFIQGKSALFTSCMLASTLCHVPSERGFTLNLLLRWFVGTQSFYFSEGGQNNLVRVTCHENVPLPLKYGSEVIFFSCSTQLSMKFSLLINMKMPTIVGIFIFISRETFMLSYV